MQGKKWIIGALIAGFVLGNGMAPAQAGILDKVIKGGVIGYAVDAPTAGTAAVAVDTKATLLAIISI